VKSVLPASTQKLQVFLELFAATYYDPRLHTVCYFQTQRCIDAKRVDLSGISVKGDVLFHCLCPPSNI